MKISRQNNQKQHKTMALKQLSMLGLILITIVGLMQIFFSPQAPPNLSEKYLLEADSISAAVEILP
ncbi:MAG: hypothetical protein AAFN10_18915 [Bacteroidota bacterium]